ncbi:MAG: ATP-dependent DNA ligase [Thermoplasmata archaeon]|nr:ATP-dependent DNA ligase [Thermoplasmata archaeon]
MWFAELVQQYERLAATPKRLEMRGLLVELLSKVPRDELRPTVYLMMGELRPEFEGVELGVADSLAAKAVALASRSTEKSVAEGLRKTGDLGTTVEELLTRGEPRLGADPLSVVEVYNGFLRIANSSGEGSQDLKIRILVELFARASPLEAKYLARFVLGKLRLGVREMTLLDALAVTFADGTKEARAAVEAAYNRSSDLGLVVDHVARRGLEGLAEIGVEVGRPVRPMLAERSPDLADVLTRMDGRAALEYKYDGLRVQAHIPASGRVKLFSRRLEEISAQFPELVAGLPGAIRNPPAIVEGECVPIDPETGEFRPFQEVSRRRGRKYDIQRLQEEVPVRLLLFDVLVAGGATTLDLPFPQRRTKLEKLVRESELVRLAEQTTVGSVTAAERFFETAIAAGCEGVMAKSLAEGSTYRAGARGFWWIKYKREYTHALADSIDGVVVGAFFGHGRRGGRYGALLLAVYNDQSDRFETFCKVGSGFDDATLETLPGMLKPHELREKPDSVVTDLAPDVWVRPSIVLEVRGAELTLSPTHRAGVGAIRPDAGLALRFPRFTGRWRDDKGPTDATTTAELVSLYRSQIRQIPKGNPAESPP